MAEIEHEETPTPRDPAGSEEPAAVAGRAERTESTGELTGRPTGEPAENTENAPRPPRRTGRRRGSDRRGRARSRIATAVGVVGELLITGGLVLALFVVYSLWWTNVLADRHVQHESDDVRRHWSAERGPGALDTKDGIGFLHVPSMSENETLVKKGTDPEELNEGAAGYYTKPVKSALPHESSGNFSLAAHRDGHGAKFHDIDRIKKGDPLVFESEKTWYVYRVFATLPQTSKYNVDVLDAVPEESGKKKPGRYITLTTCTPLYTSTYRYVVWGELERTEKVDAKRTPPDELR